MHRKKNADYPLSTVDDTSLPSDITKSPCIHTTVSPNSHSARMIGAAGEHQGNRTPMIRKSTFSDQALRRQRRCLDQVSSVANVPSDSKGADVPCRGDSVSQRITFPLQDTENSGSCNFETPETFEAKRRRLQARPFLSSGRPPELSRTP